MAEQGRLIAEREKLALPALVTLAALGVALWLCWGPQRPARSQVAHEDGALAALEALYSAAEAVRESEGRYPTWDRLEALSRVPPEIELAGTGAERHGRVPGYRLDILHPEWTQDGGRHMSIPSPATALVPADAARQLTLVARPLEPGRSGWRSFAREESGWTWVAEGVSDGPGLAANRMPDAHLTTAAHADGSRRSWVRLDRLIPHGSQDER